MLDMYLLAAANLQGRRGPRHRHDDTFWLDEVGGGRLLGIWTLVSGWVSELRASANRPLTRPDVWRSRRPADVC
jgi:hypothetical protein